MEPYYATGFGYARTRWHNATDERDGSLGYPNFYVRRGVVARETGGITRQFGETSMRHYLPRIRGLACKVFPSLHCIVQYHRQQVVTGGHLWVLRSQRRK